MTNLTIFLKKIPEGNKEHLATKQQVEELKQKFGNEWLRNQGSTTSFQNLMGYEPLSPTSRRNMIFAEILSSSPEKDDDGFSRDFGSTVINTSTPLEKAGDQSAQSIAETLYKSAQETSVVSSDAYTSAMDDTIYLEDESEAIVISDPEDYEAKFIVMEEMTGEDLFLILGEETIKEKDAMTGQTKTKWGLSTLDSCDRIKMNVIRLNFDTIRKDKKERKYEMDPKECQELERLLREILANRPLSEMCLNVYKCAKCNTQFSREVNPNVNKKMDFGEYAKFLGEFFVFILHISVFFIYNGPFLFKLFMKFIFCNKLFWFLGIFRWFFVEFQDYN